MNALKVIIESQKKTDDMFFAALARAARVPCATLECNNPGNLANETVSYASGAPAFYYLCDECEAARKSKEQDAARLRALETRGGCDDE